MKKIFFISCALISALAVQADDEKAVQEVLIDNQVVAKEVTKITFEGDNAVLTFADNTQQTADMESVVINFSYNPTGIGRVNDNAVKDQKVYNLTGMHVKNTTDGLKKGVYVVDGKKKMIK